MRETNDNHVSLFGANMRRGRYLVGMTQAELGERSNRDRRAIIRYEKGEREPRPKARAEIAKALGQPMSFFYDEHSLLAWQALQRERERERERESPVPEGRP